MAEKLGDNGHAVAHDSESDLGVSGEVGVSISLWGWLKREGGEGLRGGGNCLRPESKRDKIVCLIVASDDLEANDSTFEAGHTCAVFHQP